MAEENAEKQAYMLANQALITDVIERTELAVSNVTPAVEIINFNDLATDYIDGNTSSELDDSARSAQTGVAIHLRRDQYKLCLITMDYTTDRTRKLLGPLYDSGAEATENERRTLINRNGEINDIISGHKDESLRRYELIDSTTGADVNVTVAHIGADEKDIDARFILIEEEVEGLITRTLFGTFGPELSLVERSFEAHVTVPQLWIEQAREFLRDNNPSELWRVVDTIEAARIPIFGDNELEIKAVLEHVSKKYVSNPALLKHVADLLRQGAENAQQQIPPQLLTQAGMELSRPFSEDLHHLQELATRLIPKSE